jgi:hypothetical protein
VVLVESSQAGAQAVACILVALSEQEMNTRQMKRQLFVTST